MYTPLKKFQWLYGSAHKMGGGGVSLFSPWEANLTQSNSNRRFQSKLLLPLNLNLQ